ncbi:Hypothetical predicted protein [Pelobates cultripes]|uniref:Uncharacterized protein n=1 Tax=Pelobates cultripes TaxID=61616 RepID=A0AAD1R3K4_PELCU|nr:Hypothetical predicted protein [Pelobates cultripes]
MGMSTTSTLTPVSQGRKATAKTKHSSKTVLTDSLPTVTDGTQPPLHKRATSRAKSARLQKQARAQLDSSELSYIEEEMDESDKDVSIGQSDSDSDGTIRGACSANHLSG